MSIKEGFIFYDEDLERLDIRLLDDCNQHFYGGLHCGDTLQVYKGTKWIDVRVEHSDSKGWYLVGYEGNPEFLCARIEA